MKEREVSSLTFPLSENSCFHFSFIFIQIICKRTLSVCKCVCSQNTAFFYIDDREPTPIKRKSWDFSIKIIGSISLHSYLFHIPESSCTSVDSIWEHWTSRAQLLLAWVNCFLPLPPSDQGEGNFCISFFVKWDSRPWDLWRLHLAPASPLLEPAGLGMLSGGVQRQGCCEAGQEESPAGLGLQPWVDMAVLMTTQLWNTGHAQHQINPTVVVSWRYTTRGAHVLSLLGDPSRYSQLESSVVEHELLKSCKNDH